MLIQITNTCRMGCPHCMDCASEAAQHMDPHVYFRALDFAKWAGVRCLTISGGEPTEHPHWLSLVSYATRPGFNFASISIPTNGMWLHERRKANEMLDLMECVPQVFVQVSSFQGLYKFREEILKAADSFKQALKKVGVKQRFAVETDRALIDRKMLALGRAANDERFRKLAESGECTTSCFSSALVAAQLPFREAISTLEKHGNFCHPLVDWKGDVKWSESCLCPGFGSVREPFEELARKAHEWRPCGKCADYAKLVAKTDVKYAVGKRILGI